MSAGFIEDFITSSVFEKHLSKNTVFAYRNDLTQFFLWLEQNELNVLTIDHGLLTDYLVQKKIKGYEFSSVARTLFCFRVFFSWLLTTKKRNDNPAELLETPKLWVHLPELLSVEDIELLINSVKDDSKSSVRLRSIIELLYGCGLRISELVNLQIENINLEKKYLVCFGKGSKERLIPFGKLVRKSLKKWLDKSRNEYLKGAISQFVFISQKKTPLSRQHVWLTIKKQAQLCGIKKNIYPHIFRHSYATHLLTGGGDLRVVQELLGHADITTTQRYTQVDRSRMLKLHQKYHPRTRS